MQLLKRAKKLLFGGFRSDSVYSTIYPFSKLCRFFGFYPVSIQLENNEMKFIVDKLAYMHSVFVFIMYAAGFSLAVWDMKIEISTNDVEYSVIAYFTGWSQIYSLFILGLVALLSSWKKISSTIEIVKEVHQIDQALGEIGVTVSYKRFRSLFCMEVILLSVIPTCFSMVNCFILKVRLENKIKLCFLCIYFAPILLIVLKEIQFCNFMLLVRKKFDLINLKLTECARISGMKLLPPSETKAMTFKRCEGKERLLLNESICGILAKLSEIYGRVNDAANKVMEVFSPHLLFMTATSLGVLTIQCYNFYAFIVKSYVMTTYEITATITWIMIHSGVIYINCTVCSKSIDAMTQTSFLLHKVKWLTKDDKLFQVIQMFSLEIMHRNKNFTAGGFFNLDNKLITSIFAAVTTYLVIIIQFHIGGTESIVNGTYKERCVNLSVS